MRSREQVLEEMYEQGVTPETIQQEISMLEAEIMAFCMKEGGLQYEEGTQA